MIKLEQKPDFVEIVQLIENARKRTYQAVNTSLIELYWQVGEYISHKVQSAEWGVVWLMNWRVIWH